MYVRGVNKEAEANDPDGTGHSDPPVNRAEASKRFAETGETSLSREPATTDYSGMDALMGKAKRRSAQSGT